MSSVVVHSDFARGYNFNFSVYYVLLYRGRFPSASGAPCHPSCHQFDALPTMPGALGGFGTSTFISQLTLP